MILTSNAVNIKSYRNPITQKRTLIHPGNNDISEKEWASISKDPMVKRNLETGIFVIGAGAPSKKSAPPEKETGNTLSTLKEKEAIKVIEETFDIETLKKWGDAEKRKKVKSAIDAQLKEIKK